MVQPGLLVPPKSAGHRPADGLIAYLVIRNSRDQGDPPKSKLGGEPELTIDAVTFEGSGGRGKRKASNYGFSLPAGVAKTGKVVLTGKNTTGAASLQARLAEFDVTDRTETPICELPVVGKPGNGIEIEVPADKLKANRVYRIVISSPDSIHQAVYQFNVANR